MTEDVQTYGYEPEARIEALLETSVHLLSLEDLDALRRVLARAHPADVADVLSRLDEDDRDTVFGLIESPAAADVLTESHAHVTQSLTEDLDARTLSGIVGEMDPDDAADLLGDLDADDAAEVIEHLGVEDAENVQALLAHEEDTGGGIMTPRTAVAHRDATAGEVIEQLRREAEDEEIYALYVVDDEERLLGLVPLRRLVTVRSGAAIADVMDRGVISVTVDRDQEEIARIFTRYNLLAVPVVDDQGRLVGQITIDDIVDVIHEEASEDIYKLAGTSESEVERPTPFRIATTRLPWLLICMVGSLMSGAVIAHFQLTLEKVITLAAFIPVITATGGNSGLQASTVTVRGLVTGQVGSGTFFRTLFREIGGGLIVGMTCGLVASGIAWLWFGQPLVGVCIGTAMFLVIGVAVLVGVITPMILSKIGVDPAVASGPFITTTNDVVGLVIYLGLATLLVGHFASG